MKEALPPGKVTEGNQRSGQLHNLPASYTKSFDAICLNRFQSRTKPTHGVSLLQPRVQRLARMLLVAYLSCIPG